MSVEGSGIRLQDFRLRVEGCAPVRKLLLGYHGNNRAISWYFFTRPAKKIVRGVLGGRIIPQTQKRSILDSEVVIGVFRSFTNEPPYRCAKIH